jgi:uncharacterized membrane protein YdjX (TVP38/TMEM64 family)
MKRIGMVLRDRRFWLGLAAVLVLILARVSGISAFLFDSLRDERVTLAAFAAQHFAVAAAGYTALYAAAVALSLPAALLLTLCGGFVFGPIWGSLLTALGATAGATLVFLLARVIFGASALEKFGPQAEKLARNIKRNAWSYLLVLRLVPLFPFVIVNVIPAFAGVRLSTFVWTTFFGILPATVVFSTAGAGLGTILDQGRPVSIFSILTPEVIAALAGLAALSLLGIPLRRKFEGQRPGYPQSE